MIRLNKVLLITLASLTLCISSCKKVVKEVTEDVSEKMIAKQVAKEASEEALEKIGKKELKVIKWPDFVDAISKKMPILGEAIERLDGSVQKIFAKSINKDYKFFKALTSSNSILDECEAYSKEAPKLMKDANFIRMYVKSNIARKEGRQCIWDNLTAKEENGLIKFYP